MNSAMSFERREAPRVVIVVRGRELCQPRLAEQEILAIARLLAEAGIEAAIATEGKRPLRSRVSILRADLRLEDLSETAYAGLIIPCAGGGGRRIPQGDSPELIDLIRRFNARKKAIAAQNSGVLRPREGGNPRWRKVRHRGSVRAARPLGIHQGAGVIRDGNIITSGSCPLHAAPAGKPDSTAAMIGQFAAYIMAHHVYLKS